MMLEPGARATFHDTVFSNNSALHGAGPVAGLRASRRYGKRVGAAAWFQDCVLINNTGLLFGDVTVEDELCRVFSNDHNVSVWDESCGSPDRLGRCNLTATWLKARAGEQNASTAPGAVEDVFVDVTGRGQALPRPSDTAFRQIAGEQAARTGLPDPQLQSLPEGTDFLVWYATHGEWLVWLMWTVAIVGPCLLCSYAKFLKGCFA